MTMEFDLSFSILIFTFCIITGYYIYMHKLSHELYYISNFITPRQPNYLIIG